MIKNVLKCFTGTALSICLIAGTIPFTAVSDEVPETKLIALTFDDGPNTTTTNEVLDLLDEYNAKASFFLIGNNINDESAESVRRAYNMGCEIDNHSKSHPNMGSLSADEIKAEVEYVNEKVYDITGEYPKFFRPPFIDTSQTMYENIDMPFICGIDCQDYMDNVTAEQRAEYILNGAKDGVIVLLHDAAGNNKTVDALKIAMPELIKQGYEFVTLTELFERQGETPIEDMIYTWVTKYPCAGYAQYQNIFTGEAKGEPSWSGWSSTAVLDGNQLSELGDSYALKVEYSCEYEPVIALQKWSGDAIWHPVKPSYFNGSEACFLASDILEALDSLGVSYTDLDRITVTPYGGNMTITSVDLMVKSKETDRVSGDINADGKFDIADLVTLQNWLLRREKKLADWSAGDFSGDNVLDVFDVVLMRQQLIRSQQV